jgi:hypothetical protein
VKEEYVKTPGLWREVCVGQTDFDKLFVAAYPTLSPQNRSELLKLTLFPVVMWGSVDGHLLRYNSAFISGTVTNSLPGKKKPRSYKIPWLFLIKIRLLAG